MKKWTAFIIGIILVVIFIVTMFVLPPLLGWYYPNILSWQDFVDSISTPEGFMIGIVTEVIPIICVTIGAIFLIVFAIKMIR
ncbi:MAG: hypothetical protein ACFFDY_13210, partial [Candidatus Thorarchaeota archaeon]